MCCSDQCACLGTLNVVGAMFSSAVTNCYRVLLQEMGAEVSHPKRRLRRSASKSDTREHVSMNFDNTLIIILPMLVSISINLDVL